MRPVSVATYIAIAGISAMGCTSAVTATSDRDNSSQSYENCPLDLNCALTDGASLGTFDIAGIEGARRNTLQFQGSPSQSSGAFVRIAGRPMALATHHQFSFDLGVNARGRFLPDQAYRFDYTTTSCGGTTQETPSVGQGARVIATDLDADFTLLDLTPKQAVANPFLDREGIPLRFTPLDQGQESSVYSIHHMDQGPQQWWSGAVVSVVQKYGASFFETNTTSGDTGGFASGAPVFDAHGNLIAIHSMGIGHDTCERISGDLSWSTDFYASVYPRICPLLTPNQGCTDTHELPYVLPRTPSAYNYVQLDSHANPNVCWDSPGWVRTIQKEEHVANHEEAQARCTEADESVWLGRYRYEFDLYDAAGFNLAEHTALGRSYAPGVNLVLDLHNPSLRFTGACWVQTGFAGNTGISVYCDVPLKRGLNKATLTATDSTGQQTVHTAFICATGEPFTPSC